MRRIVEAILYLLRGGLRWRMLPLCFSSGLDHATLVLSVARQRPVAGDQPYLLMAAREVQSREASPSAGAATTWLFIASIQLFTRRIARA